ncbi:ATP-binding protein [Massilia violaceinigra]|uniref:ATP-binding protein n=1 Tax=Massilia violaceinigra TaxID=2045208 RepID=A0A2D2DLH8_9BURK|nr:ATP-binding protein [Massilia violaceinigra]ATQ75847.1 ATP-binding protein [Massilia violaceinigra]
MPNKKSAKLSEIVQVSRHYQRSIRIDMDLGRADALDGYICHGTATGVLSSMTKQMVDGNQRLFTWTGPFGGGKSSLAVAFASALGADKSLRAKAREILHLQNIPSFDQALPCAKGWLTIPIVGKRGSVVAELSKGLRRAQGLGNEARKTNSAALIADICAAAEAKTNDGVLIIIDEMGKFLEAAALGMGDDVYFFQELAEVAARSSGKIVIVGILHQSFSQYATRLGIGSRDDWVKVQGRYSDIPLVAASDEVVELIGRAIQSTITPEWMMPASTEIAASIRAQRPAVGEGFANSLAACWPLHPAMAALLGPISKRQFGQNERSTFSFLASVEPFGFRSYLETPKVQSSWYRPNDYWDYLRANLEPAILSSPDGHRWAQAVDAVERTEAKTTDPLHVELIKNIAVVDLFRNGSGLAAELSVLKSLFYDHTLEQVKSAVEQLSAWRVILFKKHIGAWSVFEGSDFDIDNAISEARAGMSGVDFSLLSSLTNLYPVIAKRHYHETGTMRWMNMALCRVEDIQRIASKFKPEAGEFGLFLLALPGSITNNKAVLRLCHEHSRMRPWPVVIGIPRNHAKIEDLGSELLALQVVQSRHELNGDPVARREVYARISSIRAQVEEQLREAVTNARWIAGENELETKGRLSPIASNLADAVYPSAPELWSELLNRDSPSSNSVKGRRDLLYRMLDHEEKVNLGIEGYPAERGLYETLLRITGLHRPDANGVVRFLPPDEQSAPTFAPLWNATRELFENSNARVKVPELHALWASAPYGLRKGVMPVMFTAFLLTHKGNLALYKDGMFIPRVTDADIDEYLQDASRFSVRWILIDQEKAGILEGISNILVEVGAAATTRDPLEAARGLVALVLGLPAWSQRTHTISDIARKVRDTLLKANDPHKVLFIDLAALLEKDGGESYVESLRSPIAEIAQAYDKLLASIQATMLEALDAPGDRLDRLRARAEVLTGVTGDLRQDAFATRLAKYDGSKESIEGILSLAANKPARDWNDRDIDHALLDIAQAALRFRQAEAFASVKGRVPTSEAFAVVIGAGAETRTVSRSFSIPDRHRDAVESMAEKLASTLMAEGHSTEILLAALAKAGMRLTLADDARMEKSHG